MSELDTSGSVEGCDTKSYRYLLCKRESDITQCSTIGTLPGRAIRVIGWCEASGTMDTSPLPVVREPRGTWMTVSVNAVGS